MLAAGRKTFKATSFLKVQGVQSRGGGHLCLWQSHQSGGCAALATPSCTGELVCLACRWQPPAAVRVVSRGSSSSLLQKLIAGWSDALADFKLGYAALCWLHVPGGVGSSTCHRLPRGNRMGLRSEAVQSSLGHHVGPF